MSKRQPSSKETTAYTAAVTSNKALAATTAASDSDYSTCHASLHCCVFDQEFVPHTPGTVLDRGAQVNILEGTLGSGTRIQLPGITGATTKAERADHSIILGRNREFYYLIIVIDSIDFTWAQPSPNRSEPEDLIHDFMTLTGISGRRDGWAESEDKRGV